MTRTLFTFDTTHAALWAEEVALENGIPCETVPAPAAVRARCNLALETLPSETERLAGLLRRTGIRFALHPL